MTLSRLVSTPEMNKWVARPARNEAVGQTQLGQSNFEQREKFAVRAREQLDIGVKT